MSEQLEHISLKVEKLVLAEILKKEELRDRKIMILISIVTLIGIGGILSFIDISIGRTIQDQLNDEESAVSVFLKDELGRITEVKVADLEKDMRNNAELDNYWWLLEQLNTNEKAVNHNLRDEIMDSLRVISSVKRIVTSSRFLASLADLVEMFTKASQNNELKEIEGIFGSRLLEHHNISINMADFYGQLIIGSPLKIDQFEDEINSLNKYLDASFALGYPEIKLMWTIFVEFKKSNYRGNSVIQKLVDSIDDFDEVEDKDNFIRVVAIYESHWEKNNNIQWREFNELVSSLREQYPQFPKVNNAEVSIVEGT